MKKLLSAALLCLASALPALAQKAVTVEPEIAAGGYDNLNAALKAVNNGTENTYVITVNQNIEGLTETIIAGAKGDKDITLQGATNEIVVKLAYATNATTFKMLLNMNSSATGKLTVKNITFDCDNKTTTNDFMAQGAATLSLENVTIKNLIYNGQKADGAFRPGMLRLTGTPTATTLNNLRFENCSVESENAPYNVNVMSQTPPTIIGNLDYILALNGNAAITDGGITTDNPTLYVIANRTLDKPIVYGSTDFSKFKINNSGKTQFMLAPVAGNINAIAKKNILLINNVDGVETGTSYDALAGGSGAVVNATTGAQLLIYNNVSVTAAMNFGGKTVEIRGVNPDVTITYATDKVLANAANPNTYITLRDLTIAAESGRSYPNVLANTNKTASSITFQNVTFKNCTTTAEALICADGGKWHLNNVTFDNCSVTTAETPATRAATASKPLVSTNTAGCSISGVNNNLSILVKDVVTKNVNIDASGLAEGQKNSPILLSFTELPTATGEESDADLGYNNTNTFITGCSDAAYFKVQNFGYALKTNDTDNSLALVLILTGIEEVAAEADGEAEYFDLRGVRVNAEALTPGLYICRKGGKVSKTVIR